MPFDLWVPPKPAIIVPAPKELLCPSDPRLVRRGLTMMARTSLLRRGPVSAAANHSNFTFVGDETSTTVDTSITFTGLSIGTAAADRWVIAGIGVVGPASGGTLTCTIGGVSATQIARANNLAGSSEAIAAIFAANVTSGTTANFVFATDSILVGADLGYWTVNMASGTSTDSATNAAGGGVSGFDISANGFAVGVSSVVDSGTDFAGSVDASFTEHSEVLNGASTVNVAFVSREVVSAVTGLGVTYTWTGATTANIATAFGSWL